MIWVGSPHRGKFSVTFDCDSHLGFFVRHLPLFFNFREINPSISYSCFFYFGVPSRRGKSLVKCLFQGEYSGKIERDSHKHPYIFKKFH